MMCVTHMATVPDLSGNNPTDRAYAAVSRTAANVGAVMALTPAYVGEMVQATDTKMQYRAYGGAAGAWSNIGRLGTDLPAAPVTPVSSFPDATNTGPVAGTVFTTTTGNLITTANGQIIENRRINNGQVDIRHSNVTVRNCIINSQDFNAIRTTALALTGCLIERCTLTGIGGSIALNTDNTVGMEIRFCNISGYENGINIGGNGLNIHDNYIHGLTGDPETAHVDGIQGSGGFTSCTIQHNTIVSWDTSNIISQTEGAGFSGLVIDNNLLLCDSAHGNGKAYGILCQTVNANVASDVTITNNRIQKSATQGQNYIFVHGLTGTVTVTGNVDDTTGAPITADGDIFPDATNTGVPAGVTLTPYTGNSTITVPGTVIEGKIFTERLTIAANNVTIRNCLFKFADLYGMDQDHEPVNTRIEHCEIDGTGSTRMSALLVGGGANSAVIGCNIHSMVIAIQLQGKCEVRDNYIHDLFDTSSNPDDRHFDGITCFGGGDGTVIEHNTIIMPSPDGGTACVFIATRFGNINDVTVNNNVLRGKPSYTVYSEETQGFTIMGVKFTNNIMEFGGFGYANIQDNVVVWTNNRDYTTGNVITL